MAEPILVGLDRDGTLIRDAHYLGWGEDWTERFEFLDTVIEGIKLLNTVPRIRITVITNQAGVARGYFDCKRVEEVNSHLVWKLAENGAYVHSVQYCPYVDRGYAEEKRIFQDSQWVLSRNDPKFNLRKPGTGMLEKAAQEVCLELPDFEEIYVIGDKLDDMITAKNAKGKGIFLYNGENDNDRERLEKVGFTNIKENFYECALSIIEDK